MVIKQYKIKPYGSPSSANVSQTSNPRTPEEKVQALADFFEAGLGGVILEQYAEEALLIKTLQYAAGTDGSKDLKTYEKQLENNFPDMATGTQQPKVDKELQPELKKVNREKKVGIPIPGSKGFGGGSSNKKGKK